MSRFANMFSNNKDNEGFQVYSRRRPNNYSGYRNPIQEVKKEEKLITEENFPSLSTTPIVARQPVLNYLENAKVISPQVIVEEKKVEEIKVEEKEVLFTHDDAKVVFMKLVKNWESYENNYIKEYGEHMYLKQYGNYLHSYDLSDTESEIESDTEYEEW
jgi:hypothetical protein